MCYRKEHHLSKIFFYINYWRVLSSKRLKDNCFLFLLKLYKFCYYLNEKQFNFLSYFYSITILLPILDQQYNNFSFKFEVKPYVKVGDLIFNIELKDHAKFQDLFIENKFNTNLKNFKIVFLNLIHKSSKNLFDSSSIFLSQSFLQQSYL